MSLVQYLESYGEFRKLLSIGKCLIKRQISLRHRYPIRGRCRSLGTLPPYRPAFTPVACHQLIPIMLPHWNGSLRWRFVNCR